MLALLLLFTACTPAKVDADGDGVAAGAGADCDDGDPSVHPGADEVCGGGDEDCDGLEDDDDPGVADATTRAWKDSDADGLGDPGSDGFFCAVPPGHVADATDCDDADPAVGAASPWYLDSDGDAYGDPTRTETGCAPSPGYVADGTDCDDAQDTVSPSARELCDGEDDDCDGTVDEDDAEDAATWYLDADGDGHGDAGITYVSCDAPPGYVGTADDCDDTRADVSPSQAEVCDAADTDEDCDGLSDGADDGALADGMSSWYPDSDGDGYGDGSVGVLACDVPAGHVADGTDCDDGFALAHPGGIEVCDAADRDEDCNRAWDDYDPGVDPATRTTWYFDLDRDGYGDPTVTTFVQCEQPYGTVSNGADCDDADAFVSPSATEVCDDIDFDEDCDGLRDDADPSVDVTTFGTFYADSDGDGYGEETVTNASCDPTAGYAAEYGDCDLADPAISPGSPEICGDSTDDNCDGSTDCVLREEGAMRAFYGPAYGDHLASAMGSAGDMDGDGIDDLVLGAREYLGGYGEAWIAAGGATGDIAVTSATATLAADADLDFVGSCVSALGDVDGDGFDDVLVGAEGTRSSNVGYAHVISGPVTGTTDLGTHRDYFYGEDTDDYAGAGCAPAGDVSGDGRDDFLIGSSGYDSSKGAVYLLTSTPGGARELSVAAARMSGETTYDLVGDAVDGAGDVNGDGFDDMLIGASGDDDAGSSAGAAYIVLGPQAGSLVLSGADAKLRGEAAGHYAGHAVAGLGDMDGDGYDDIAVGAPLNGDGVAYVVSGPISGTSSLASATARIEGSAGLLARHGSLAGADFDADGLGDLAVGTPWAGTTYEGAVYLFHGPLAGTYADTAADLTIAGSEAYAYLNAVAFVGAQDGRPGFDVLVSATHSDAAYEDAGAVYLFSLAGY